MSKDSQINLRRIPDAVREFYSKTHTDTFVEILVKAGVPVVIVLSAITGGATFLPKIVGDDRNIHDIRGGISISEEGKYQVYFKTDIGYFELGRGLTVENPEHKINDDTNGHLKESENGIPYLEDGRRLMMSATEQKESPFIDMPEISANEESTKIIVVGKRIIDDQETHVLIIEDLSRSDVNEIILDVIPYDGHWSGDSFIFSGTDPNSMQNSIGIFDTELNSIQLLEVPFEIQNIQASPNGSLAFVITRDGDRQSGGQLVDLNSGQLKEVFKNIPNGKYAIGWNPASNQVAIASFEYETGNPNVQLISLASPDDPQSFSMTEVEIPETVRFIGQPDLNFDQNWKQWIFSTNSPIYTQIGDLEVIGLKGSVLKFDQQGMIIDSDRFSLIFNN